MTQSIAITEPQAAGASIAPEKPVGVHLGFIDALRALAALYVVVFHAIKELEPYQRGLLDLHPKGGKAFGFLVVTFFRHGHLAVAIFIVISGFCLMLPLARRDRVQMEGIAPFLWRRARRILPPYYAALAISLLLMLVAPGMNRVAEGEWRLALPAFGLTTIISHLLLFHHWNDQWINKIDPPLWSIGVEWQMYFLMPLFFLPLLRRLGRIGMLLLTGLLGVVLTFAGVGLIPTTQDYIHFVALFAAGMITAQICFSPSAECERLRRRLPAGRSFFTLLFLVLVLLGLQTRRTWAALPLIRLLGRISWDQIWLIDYLVAACFCSLLLSLCQELPSAGIQWIHRILNWKPLAFVGHFSYSIYLIHDPVLRAVCTAGEALRLSALQQSVAGLVLGAPFAVFCGYLLYWTVERHFIASLPTHSR